MDIVTTDLAKFGQRELELASELIKAYAQKRPEFLGEKVMLNFNTHSGEVFLSDDDFNTGLLDDQELKRWATCCICGREGFADERNESGWKVFADPRICEECVEQAAEEALA